MPKLKAVVFVPKQGVEHFEEMLAWLRKNIGSGNFQWFGYDMGAYHSHIQIQFYNEESAIMFKLMWGGKSKV